MAENEVKYKALFRELLANVSASLDEPQDYLDLDAGGFLLVALGHLVKAIGKLGYEPPSSERYNALFGARIAVNHIRFALRGRRLLESV